MPKRVERPFRQGFGGEARRRMAGIGRETGLPQEAIDNRDEKDDNRCKKCPKTD